MLDNVLKVALVLLAVVIIGWAWRGVPVEVVIAGPSSSSGGVPVSVSGVGGGRDRFDVATATNGVGTVFVTRVDKWTGDVEVFRMDLEGKLTPVDKK